MGKVSCGNVDDVDSRSGQSGGIPSSIPSSTSAHYHRRSKSASDWKLDLTTTELSKRLQKNSDGSLGSIKSMRVNENQERENQVHQDNVGCATPNHRASLEKDIEQLQMRLHKEKSVRILLEKALGRASSTLSPGHKHLTSHTRELISEIQLLEDEVANREQHVLSLYRSIFDQCVSGVSSAQCSGTPSPSHTKTAAKKHPHIISSAFCSSRKFSFQTFQLISSIKDSGKMDRSFQSKVTRQSSSHSNCFTGRNISSKIPKTASTAGKRYFERAHKNGIHHHPNRLSEEMVRCMASIYCWLCLEETKDRGKETPILSRSSTSTVRKHGFGDDCDLSTETLLEISCISTNKNPFSTTNTAIRNYRALAEQLERVDMGKLETKAKLAFWINVYNSLIMHAYLTHGIPSSSFARMSLFRKTAYNIGGYIISATNIEHFILGCRTPRISRWLETILWSAMRKKSGEEKQVVSSGFNLLVTQPVVCFGLCTGASSDPPLKVYTAEHVEEELELAKNEFLQANVVVKKSRKIFLPKLLDRYSKEASIATDDLVAWISTNVDKDLQESIQRCISSSSKRKTSQMIEWIPYNPRFRYIFNKKLTGKP